MKVRKCVSLAWHLWRMRHMHVQQGELMNLAEVKRTRNLYLVVSTIALAVFGLIYAWSIFATPLSTEFGWDRGALQNTFNIVLICFCIAQLVGGIIVGRLGSRNTLLLAGVLALAGFGGTALFADISLWGIYVSYGVLGGFGGGMSYIVVISGANSWFPDKIGFSSGVLMMGAGLGSLVFGTPLGMLADAIGVRGAFVVLAVVTFAVSVFMAFFLKSAPADIGAIVSRPGAVAVNESAYENDNPLTTPVFYVYFAWAVLCISVGVTLIGGSKQGALVVGVEDVVATFVVGLVSTMNGLGRFVFGTLFDKLGLRKTMIASSAVTLVAAAGLAFSYASSASAVYIVSALLVGLGYGAIPVIASGFVRERFGGKNYARNLGLVNLSAALASFLGIGIVALSSPDGASTNLPVWVAFTVIAALALACCIAFYIVYRKPAQE